MLLGERLLLEPELYTLALDLMVMREFCGLLGTSQSLPPYVLTELERISRRSVGISLRIRRLMEQRGSNLSDARTAQDKKPMKSRSKSTGTPSKSAKP
jgi:hypothetical protein